MAITLAAFLFVMPSSQSKPHEKRKIVVHEDIPLHAISIENPHLQQLLSEYEDAITALMKNSQTPGAAIAIVRDTSVIFLKGFGVKSAGTTDSVNSETVFRLGSVSKCFAPILTGILVKDNILSWDDRVVKYLPTFSLQSPEQTQLLSLRHVLSHTVGLPYHTYTNMVEEGKSLPEMLDKLREIPTINKVGTVYSYQNVAYSIISEVIQSATGKTYEMQMMDSLFTPLHMKHASISFADIKKNNNVAKPHLHTRSGLKVIPISNTYYNVAPAGGVNASASDMALWIEALLGNRNKQVDNSILDKVFTPVIKAPSKNRNFRKHIKQTGSYYALGWRVLDFQTDTLFYHGGYVNGYRSELAISRKDKIGICILTNSTGALADNSAPTFFDLYFSKRDSIQQWENRHDASRQH